VSDGQDWRCQVPIARIRVLEGRYDDLILLEVAFISGRPKQTRLALLKGLNAQVVERAGISPDDLPIQLSEVPGENFSFGQGLAQRACVSAGTVADGDASHTSIGNWRRT
jgi:hypothetical protein